MTWGEYTGDVTDGAVPMADQLETMLTAHPAWEHVEDVTSWWDQIHVGSSEEYHAETHLARIWKCLGTQNGLGQDFFVAVITSTIFYPTEEDVLEGESYDMGAVWLIGMEQWDVTTHKMRRPVGIVWNYNGDGGDLYLDENNCINGDVWFPLISSQESEDGLVWGSWSNWNNDISSVPANLNDRSIWDSHYEPPISMQYASFIGDTSPSGTVKTYFRVTDQGIFIYSDTGRNGVDSRYPEAGYVGLGDERMRPEELQTGFPLIWAYRPWSGESGNAVPVSRLPEWGQDTPVDFFESYNRFDFDWTVGANRAEAPFPGLAPAWAVLRGTVSLEPISTDSWDAAVHYPGTTVPGVYLLSNQGGPFAEYDTITSPEGNECMLFAYGYLPSSLSNARWNVVDMELD